MTTRVQRLQDFRGSCWLLLSVASWVIAGCAAGVRQPETVPEIHPGMLQGYLSTEALPNSLALVPAPPSGRFGRVHS